MIICYLWSRSHRCIIQLGLEHYMACHSTWSGISTMYHVIEWSIECLRWSEFALLMSNTLLGIKVLVLIPGTLQHLMTVFTCVNSMWYSIYLIIYRIQASWITMWSSKSVYLSFEIPSNVKWKAEAINHLHTHISLSLPYFTHWHLWHLKNTSSF